MVEAREAELAITATGGTAWSVKLTKTPFVLGRALADVDLKDAAVSRRHCELYVKDRAWGVRDLGSANGTFVNGVRIGETFLADGDRIALGHCDAVFKLLNEPMLPEPPPPPVPAALADDAAMLRLAELAVGAADPAAWCQGYLETVVARLAADRGFVMQVQPETGVLVTVAAVGLEEVPPADGSPPLSRTIVEQAIREDRIIHTTNAEHDPRFSDATSVGRFDIRSVVCAPTRWQSEAQGAVYLERALPKESFTEEHGEQLQDLADLLGIAQMAWRAHHASHRAEWEKEWLSRTFPAPRVASILAAGGASMIRRELKEACHLRFAFPRLTGLLEGHDEEGWRILSQMLAQVHDIVLRRGGLLLATDAAVFESEGGEAPQYAIEAVRAAVEAQRSARPLIKRLAREHKASLAFGIGASTGTGISGWFGAGRRVDYWSAGPPLLIASGLAAQSQDGEILVDLPTQNRIRLFLNTHRLAPVSIPGAEGPVQIFRIVE